MANRLRVGGTTGDLLRVYCVPWERWACDAEVGGNRSSWTPRWGAEMLLCRQHRVSKSLAKGCLWDTGYFGESSV